MNFWERRRIEKAEKKIKDCSTCGLYVEEEGSGCIPFSKGTHEEARDLCKAARHRRGKEQEDCEVCSSHAYRENDVRKMCGYFNAPLLKVAVLNHPAATGVWGCQYWKSKLEIEEEYAKYLVEVNSKANREAAERRVEEVVANIKD